MQQNIYTHIHNLVQGMSLANDMPRPQILFCSTVKSFLLFLHPPLLLSLIEWRLLKVSP